MILLYLPLVIWAAFTIFPFIYMLILSTKGRAEIFHFPPPLFFDENSIPIPTQVTTIQGIEILTKSPLYKMAYLRFGASKAFVDEMIAKEYERYNYTPIECQNFFVNSQTIYLQDYPQEFKWWNPSEVETPICYRGNDTRFLLIDTNHDEVYYYRTTISH